MQRYLVEIEDQRCECVALDETDAIRQAKLTLNVLNTSSIAKVSITQEIEQEAFELALSTINADRSQFLGKPPLTREELTRIIDQIGSAVIKYAQQEAAREQVATDEPVDEPELVPDSEPAVPPVPVSQEAPESAPAVTEVAESVVVQDSAPAVPAQPVE